jgi:hypothetical protein
VVRGACLAEPLDGCGVEVTVEATALDGRRRVREGPGRPTFDLSRADAWFETGTDFTLGPLPSGLPLRLTTRLDGLEVASLEIAPLAAGEERRVDMPMPRLGAVRGRLLDERGTPLHDRWVGLYVAGDRPLGPARFGYEPGRFESVRGVRTDERGEFTLCGIPFGRWGLAAGVGEGHRAFGSDPCDIGEVFDLDAPLREVELRFPHLVELSVSVHDADGTPAEGRIELDPDPFDAGGRWSVSRWFEETPFLLAVRPERHRIRARSWGLDTDWVDVTPPAEIELRYPPTRRVVATLVDPTGTPVDTPVGVEHERGIRTVMPGVGMCENGGIVLERIPQEPVTLHLTVPGLIARRELPGGSGELDLGRIVMEPACEVRVRSAGRDAPRVLALDLGERGVRLLREGWRITLPPEPVRAVPMRAHFAVSHDCLGNSYPGLTEPPDTAVRAALRSAAARTLDLRGRRRYSIDLDELIPQGE